jgi:prolyl oligopeptidase
VRYPHSERGPVIEMLHGVEVADPYRWLEDPDSVQTRQWVAAQNAVTEEYLAGLASRRWFHEQLSAILGVPRAGVPRACGGRYLLDRNDGSQDQDVVTVADDLTALAAGGRVLIDPAEFSADGTASVPAVTPSPDGRWVAYQVSEAGSDWTRVRVRSVDSGRTPRMSCHTRSSWIRSGCLTPRVSCTGPTPSTAAPPATTRPRSALPS